MSDFYKPDDFVGYTTPHPNHVSYSEMARLANAKRDAALEQLLNDRHAFAMETQMYRDAWLKDQQRIEKLETALQFFGEAYTWARVSADYKADVRLNDMYGAIAREALK